jgi:hypothetical protein
MKSNDPPNEPVLANPWLAGPPRPIGCRGPGDHGFDRFIGVYRWQSDAVERGRSLTTETGPKGPAVAIGIDRIVYTEHWLRRRGYALRQFWSRSP